MVIPRRKIVVLSSCTSQKKHVSPIQLRQADFALNEEAFYARETHLAPLMLPAENMYIGQQHVRLMGGIEKLRSNPAYDIQLYIVSAGYGIVRADQKIAPYECTFQTMKTHEILDWSTKRGIPNTARTLFAQPADLMIVMLGDQYLTALQLDDTATFATRTLFFCSTGSLRNIPSNPHIVRVALNNLHAKRYHCGLVGLKGELAARLLRRINNDYQEFEATALSYDPDKIMVALDQPYESKTKKPALVPKLEQVHHQIELSDAWRNASQDKPIRFFIPDWDDMVDPDYDFQTDTHSGGQGAWVNQVYAHQLLPQPSYDGILVSRAVAESSRKKLDAIKQAGGIHQYLRVPRQLPVLGDCGAFSYLLQEKPPYETGEILDYYTDLNFDFGVSIDHLVFGAATEEGRQARYNLTVTNAEEFIAKHRERKLEWTPIGALQGLYPQDYAEAARKYVECWGYTYLAIGGQVRSRTADIVQIASAVRKVIPADVKLHVFGVARLEVLNDFIQLSIDSVNYIFEIFYYLRNENLILKH